MYSIDSRL